MTAGEQGASTAATKVAQAAANLQQASARKRRKPTSAETIARRYLQAIDAHDVNAAVELWAPGGRERAPGQAELSAPDGVRDHIAALLRAVPDLRVEIVSATSEHDRCALHWRYSGTFAGAGQMAGLTPTGDPITLEGLYLLAVRGGLIQANDAFTDTTALPRQVGMMPRAGSPAEQWLIRAFNAKTTLAKQLGSRRARPA